ncbi:uncharacterized protein Z520_10122 [Fonsecaea multimorphosa CBS 102226]|uniref:Uncharacterized protein n=1 Tax=Fonsecaea multimorphosa CBS 102226 TaxID=1442371 RepID=A0A0D2IAB9_9EURO|nr:uncharacterized protein Z520_10122 [Fonsecaea multimorphosa CBS 102226]KIX94096.1 hypothetical protein Z520_10122 [Fonsecaea multimorphosa CBS 102226]OAL19449.1 hypothetical protein AYO22_09611 [Fonsecaea multimorphosa]
MAPLLPPELLYMILQKCPCRRSQIQQLLTFYNDTFHPPPVLVAYGLDPDRTGKTTTIISVLESRNLQYGVIKSHECLSQRHLLSKIFAACISAFHGDDDHQLEDHGFDRTDSINALLENLRRLFEHSAKKKRFVAVIEDADAVATKGQGPGGGQTLLPALARLGDLVPGFSIILTSSSPRPLTLHKAGVPCVHFPPYTRAEAISIIISQTTPTTTAPPLLSDSAAHSKLYAQFVMTVYDSLISSTASTSIETFRLACERLWPRFIHPIVSGQEPPGNAKSWDFARLLVANRGLFRSEGEDALQNTFPRKPQQNGLEDDSVIPSAPATPSKRATPESSHPASSRQPSSKPSLSESSTMTRRPSLLKHFPTLVLLSAYLASHTLPKHDILLFSRLSATSSSTSKKIRRLRQTPTKKKTTSTSTKDAATPTKSRTKSLFAAGANFGIPRPFTLERLVAILRAIHPQGIPNRPGRGVSDRIYRELGELERLRLVVRWSGSGTATGAGGTGDDAGDEKWRVNVGREWVVNMGRMWGMGVSEYEIDHDL